MILKNALIYTPENTFKKGDLAVNGSVISEPAAGDSKIFDASGLYAIPGLTDIHLHGCMGHDFCDAAEDTLEAIAAYQARSGVTGFVPASMTFSEKKQIGRASCRERVSSPV